MAEQARKTSRGRQPISRHPLFPAIVALWFGALFGLGSIAVRSSLIESVILAGHIDTLIPAVAPPLGMTTRILLALAMAGIGGTIGATIARRIARPKPAMRQRMRGAATAKASSGYGAMDSFEAFDDNFAPGPFAADEEDEAHQAPSGRQGRRRALAIEHNAGWNDGEEHVPLPGGAPQIFNVAEHGLDKLESAESRERETAGESEATDLELSEFEAENQWHAAEPSADDRHDVEPVPEEPDTMVSELLPAQTQNRRFDAPSPVDDGADLDESAQAVASQPASPAFAAPDESGAGRGSFSAPPVADTPAAVETPLPPVRPFAAPGAVPEDTHFEETASSPSLPRLGWGDEPETDTREEWAEQDEDLREMALAEQSEPSATYAAQSEETAAPAVSPAPEGAAAERILSADLNDLSHVELLERLALSLNRRRHQSAPANDFSSPEASATFEAAEPAPAVPQPYEPDHFEVEPDSEMPVAETAVSDEAVDEEPAAPAPAASMFPPAPSIPRALRPVGLGDGDDEDDLPHTLVQRHLVRPSDRAPQETASDDAADEAEDWESADAAVEGGLDEVHAAHGHWHRDQAQDSDEDGLDDEDEESRLLEDGYSSLLDLTRSSPAKHQFVRIEDAPGLGSDAIEPVVIFPGHATARNAPVEAPAEAAATPPAGGQTPPVPARPFDDPDTTAALAPPVKAASANSQDPEETERALRAALATLQRMSGAA